MSKEALEALDAARQRMFDRMEGKTPSIDLDCAPGPIRPGDLIAAVLQGTGLEAGEPISKVFGNWTWEFPEVPMEDWKAVIRPVIKPRIELLHQEGYIRYGSW